MKSERRAWARGSFFVGGGAALRPADPLLKGLRVVCCDAHHVNVHTPTINGVPLKPLCLSKLQKSVNPRRPNGSMIRTACCPRGPKSAGTDPQVRPDRSVKTEDDRKKSAEKFGQTPFGRYNKITLCREPPVVL